MYGIATGKSNKCPYSFFGFNWPHLSLSYVEQSRKEHWRSLGLFVTIGYLILGRSFAYFGIPQLKLFIAELLICAFLLLQPRAVLDVWFTSVQNRTYLRELCIGIGVFVITGVIEVCRGIQHEYPSITALRDFAFNYYCLYLFFGIFLGGRYRGWLKALVVRLAWWNGVYGLAYLAILNKVDILIPGTSNPPASIFGQPGGSALAILGLLCYRKQWTRLSVIAVLLNTLVLLGMEVRAEWLGFIVGVALYCYLTKSYSNVLIGCGTILGVLALSYALDISVPKPSSRGGGSMSAREIIGRAISSVDKETAAEYSKDAKTATETAEWRTTWWKAIYHSVTNQDESTTILGHGYGYPLTDLVWYLRGRHFLRTPHSYFFYALGYGGWGLLTAFLVMQLLIGVLLWRAFQISGQPFPLITWAVLLTWGLFDSSFETPIRAVPFYIIVGAGISPVLLFEKYRQQYGSLKSLTIIKYRTRPQVSGVGN